MRNVKKNARQRYEAHRHEAPDPQGLMIISSCALILEAYRELIRNGASNDDAFDAVRRSFSSIFASPASRAVRVLMMLTPDPVSTLRRTSIAPMFRTTFGQLFTFEERRTEDSFVFVIPKCGIHEFFVREGEPQLTRAFCAWDRNWLGVMDASTRPIATRRSLTLVTDGVPCEFHFEPAPSEPSPTVDVTL